MRTSARTHYEQAASMFVVGDLTEARNVAAALSAPWSVEEADPELDPRGSRPPSCSAMVGSFQSFEIRNGVLTIRGVRNGEEHP
jgi:hypothetical protein